MTYPCGIIKDLLPLYIDDMCSAESREAVEVHLAECAGCKCCYEAMKEGGSITAESPACPSDLEMARSLKQVKKQLHKKIIKTVLCAIAAAAACLLGYHLLFNVPLKNVPLDAVSVSANVYSIEELVAGQAIPPDSVVISAGEDDDSEPVPVRIPEIGDEIIAVAADVMDKYDYISVITMQSGYFLRTILREVKDDTIYITAIRTTFFNNKTPFQNNTCNMEFAEINRIVFVEKDGSETLLWSR